ncbi:unnamed protein product [Leptidea sinapis]|uniref:Uncharacterized protein n=1 Tax=Leptidea sinapis TaxID=189913 RepID=A0A5E4QJG9_9NEOP|nr:unnamed protein product [Leptidea sinapis]
MPAGEHAHRSTRECDFYTHQGCQFREHVPDESLGSDAAVMEIYNNFREIIAMRPPQLMFPERLTRLVPREAGDEIDGRLQCKEVFWWEGIQLVPPRPTLGLLGKLYSSSNKFNPHARPGSPSLSTAHTSAQSLTGNNTSAPCASPIPKAVNVKPIREESPKQKPGAPGKSDGGVEAADDTSDTDESEQSSDSVRTDEDTPPRKPRQRLRSLPPPAMRNKSRRWGTSGGGRLWAATVSARSNQDGQRRYEERAASHMCATLAKKLNQTAKSKPQPGLTNIYSRFSKI